jgi:hypothetical protein
MLKADGDREQKYYFMNSDNIYVLIYRSNVHLSVNSGFKIFRENTHMILH